MPRGLVLGRRRSAPLLGALAAQALASVAVAADWLPVASEDLSMTTMAEAPGAPAAYLYQQIDRDDAHYHQTVYVRLKILKEEGRGYGDVEIPYVKGQDSVRDIQARTLCPDGRILPFSGAIFDKPISTERGVKVLAKTFSLPGVQPGCIIEYRYRYDFPFGWIFDSHWLLSQNLYVREEKFSLTPAGVYSLRWSWPNGLPPDTRQPRLEKGRVLLETHHVPAFVSEDHMPPEDQLKYRVDFIYFIAGSRHDDDASLYWPSYAKQRLRDIEQFLDRPAAMHKAVAQIVLPGDAAENKLRKLYARVQRMRNYTYERPMSEEEIQRERREPVSSIEDVWKHGAGTRYQLNWLFLAMARAAGVAADPVLSSARDEHVFDARVMNPDQLNLNLVVVSVGGRDLYLAPGIPFTRFGTLPWWETDTRALRLNAAGGTWINTPLPEAGESRLQSTADLRLADGALEGRLTVRFSGLEASWRRLAERNDDEVSRRQFLEQEVTARIPGSAEVRLTGNPNWDDAEQDLVAEFAVRVAGWATLAGHRQLLAVGLLGNPERQTFVHATRVHPLYFGYPYERRDELSIELPPGWHVESVPQAHAIDLKGVVFSSSADGAHQSLHVRRDLTINMYLADVKFYPALRKFFENVRTSDEEQAVVAADESGAGH